MNVLGWILPPLGVDSADVHLSHLTFLCQCKYSIEISICNGAVGWYQFGAGYYVSLCIHAQAGKVLSCAHISTVRDMYRQYFWAVATILTYVLLHILQELWMGLSLCQYGWS